MTDQGPVTLIEGIKAHKWLVILSGLGVAALVAGLTWVTSPGAIARGQLGLVYPATDNVLLPLPAGDATMARYTAQRALFAKSDVVLEDAAGSVPDVTVEELRGALSVVASKTANAILITGSADSPQRAVILTQALMDSYRTATAEDVAARSAANSEGWTARGDNAKAEQILIEGESFGDGVEFEVSPNLSGTESRKLVTRESVLGLFVGLGVGALLAWSVEDSRRRRRDAVTEEAP